MQTGVTSHASRKAAVIAFKLLFQVMVFSVPLHVGPYFSRILAFCAFVHLFASVSSFRPLLLVPGKFNRFLNLVLRTSRSSKNVYYFCDVGRSLYLDLVYLKYEKKQVIQIEQ